MARPEPRTLEVIRKQQLTPNMLRVTLGGPGLADFPADQTSAYIKLRLHDARSGRDVTRTYTVRSQRADEIDVDFALHEVCGPATLWAIAARPGDTVLVGGPGPRKLVRPDAPSYLFGRRHDGASGNRRQHRVACVHGARHGRARDHGRGRHAGACPRRPASISSG